MGLFSSGGMGSANTHARLQTAKNTRKIAQAMQQQQALQGQSMLLAGNNQGEAARIQWCIDRIQYLEAEVASLRAQITEQSN